MRTFSRASCENVVGGMTANPRATARWFVSESEGSRVTCLSLMWLIAKAYQIREDARTALQASDFERAQKLA